jgi:dimethylamine/trimethylamine dehydrogenase
VISYRTAQLRKLKNVEVITSVTLDAEQVRDYGADIAIIATGSRWADNGLNPFTHDTIPGADAALDHILTPEQLVLEHKPIPGERVLIYDCDGYFTASTIAEKLADEGKQVRLVTPLPSVAQYCFYTGEGFEVARRLAELNIETAAAHTLTHITPTSAVAASGAAEIEWQTDAVVLVTQRVSQDALYHQLADEPDGGPRVYRIGDCVVPRLIADCVFDGHRLGREIDTSDPGVALPYIREHRLLGASDRDYDTFLNRAMTEA